MIVWLKGRDWLLLLVVGAIMAALAVIIFGGE